MGERQIFGLIVRITGFGFSIYSVFFAFSAVAKLFNLSAPSRTTLPAVLLAFGVFLLIGVALMGTAEWIVRFAYRPKEHIPN